MREKMIPGPPKMAGKKKPKTEFEAFDALASRLLKVPKSAILAKPVKRKQKVTRQNRPA